MSDETWMMVGEDDWVFGVPVRGMVRDVLAAIYYDEDRDNKGGGWIWLTMSSRACPTNARGVAVSRIEAARQAERALGIR